MSSDTTFADSRPKPFAFVLMPFSSEFDDVYQIGIKEACESGGAYCERVDEQIFHERILDRIYNQISKADLIIADMTGKNANVFYEVGYAHALGRPTFLLASDTSDIPFDLKHHPHIIYGEKLITLRSELAKKITWFVENPPSSASDTTMGLELIHGETRLESAVLEYGTGGEHFEITVRNSSSHFWNAGEFRLGIISDRFEQSLNLGHDESTKLPEGGWLHMLPAAPGLFPEALGTIGFTLIPDPDLNVGDEHEIRFRVFSRRGNRDFPVLTRHI